MTVPTIYAVAAEDTSFILTGSAAPNTFGLGTYRGGWARGSIYIDPAAAADPPTNRAATYTFLGGPQNTFWVHGVIAWGVGGGNTSAGCSLLRCLDGGIPRICVRGTGTGGQLSVDKEDISGAFTNLFTTAGALVPSTGLSTIAIDLSVVYAGGTVDSTGTVTDISFISGTPPVIHSRAGDFVAGFKDGNIVVVSGSTYNDGTYEVGTATGFDLTLIRGETLTNEAAGATIEVNVLGSVTLYINSVKAGSFSGNVVTNSATALDQVDFSSPSSSAGIYLSEVLVSDTKTINAGVWTIAPVAAGNTQNWSGTASDINGFTINDANFIATDMAGVLSEWTISTSQPTGAWSVAAVVEEVRAARGSSGPASIDYDVRTGGTSDTAGNTPLLTVFQNFQYVWAVNPITFVQWTTGDLGTGFNIGVESDV